MPPTTCIWYPVGFALEKMTNYVFNPPRIYIIIQTSTKSPITIPFPDWWLLAYLTIPCISDYHHLNLFWMYSVAFENGNEGAPWRRDAGCSCSPYCCPACCELILAFSPLLSFIPLNWCFYESIVITPKHIITLVTTLSLSRFSSATSPLVCSASTHSYSSSSP